MLGLFLTCGLFKSNDAELNLIVAEAGLILAPMGRDIRSVHLWTQRNVTCDRQSRLRGASQVAAALGSPTDEANAQTRIPEELLSLPRAERNNRDYKVMTGQRLAF